MPIAGIWVGIARLSAIGELMAEEKMATTAVYLMDIAGVFVVGATRHTDRVQACGFGGFPE